MAVYVVTSNLPSTHLSLYNISHSASLSLHSFFFYILYFSTLSDIVYLSELMYGSDCCNVLRKLMPRVQNLGQEGKGEAGESLL